MKPRVLAAAFLVSASFSNGQTAVSPRLEVHEWGTFTLVSGADGAPIPWWQALGLPAQDLPPFVHRNMQGLKSAPALVRMETPVLYFYPTTPIVVQVTAEMKNGRITEWFPPPATAITSGPASQDNIVTWRGNLLPPGDAAALAAVPPVSGAAGGHYAHARQVPGAWFVRATTAALDAEAPPQVHTEKLIFYRGAANFQPPWRPRLTADGALRLSGEPGAPEIRHAFPIRSDGQPSPATVQEWRAQMLAALTDSGLTPHEARAMIATWNVTGLPNPATASWPCCRRPGWTQFCHCPSSRSRNG